MSTATPARARRLSLPDRWRLISYFSDFNLWMSDYPQREYRRIAKSLKAEVRAAAAEVGMKQALADLGSPRRLASGYLDGIRGKRPRWLAGSIAAVFALYLPVVAALVFHAGSISTLDAQGGGRVTLSFLGLRMENFVEGPGGPLGANVTAGAAWWVWGAALTLAVFVLVSRAWRALPRR